MSSILKRGLAQLALSALFASLCACKSGETDMQGPTTPDSSPGASRTADRAGVNANNNKRSEEPGGPNEKNSGSGESAPPELIAKGYHEGAISDYRIPDPVRKILAPLKSQLPPPNPSFTVYSPHYKVDLKHAMATFSGSLHIDGEQPDRVIELSCTFDSSQPYFSCADMLPTDPKVAEQRIMQGSFACYDVNACKNQVAFDIYVVVNGKFQSNPAHFQSGGFYIHRDSSGDYDDMAGSDSPQPSASSPPSATVVNPPAPDAITQGAEAPEPAVTPVPQEQEKSPPPAPVPDSDSEAAPTSPAPSGVLQLHNGAPSEETGNTKPKDRSSTGSGPAKPAQPSPSTSTSTAATAMPPPGTAPAHPPSPIEPTKAQDPAQDHSQPPAQKSKPVSTPQGASQASQGPQLKAQPPSTTPSKGTLPVDAASPQPQPKAPPLKSSKTPRLPLKPTNQRQKKASPPHRPEGASSAPGVVTGSLQTPDNTSSTWDAERLRKLSRALNDPNEAVSMSNPIPAPPLVRVKDSPIGFTPAQRSEDQNQWRDQAIGSQEQGSLREAAEFPDAGPGFLSRDHSVANHVGVDFSTDWTLDILTRAFAKLNEMFLGRPAIVLGNVANRNGGRLYFKDGIHYQMSHQNGLDADIGLPSHQAIRTFFKACATVRTAQGVQCANNATISPQFDTQRFLQLIENLTCDETEPVLIMFLDRQIKRNVCQFAAENHKDLSPGSCTFRALKALKPDVGHYHHVHVRLKCPGTASCFGYDTPVTLAQGTGCQM